MNKGEKEKARERLRLVCLREFRAGSEFNEVASAYLDSFEELSWDDRFNVIIDTYYEVRPLR